MKISQANIPSDLSLAIPMRATYQHLVFRIVFIDVSLKGHFLVYVIHLPQTNNVFYNLYHVLPLPIKLKGTDSKFIFIQPEHDYLLMDTAKWYFTRLGVDRINKCKIVSYVNRLSQCSLLIWMKFVKPR